MPSLDHVGPSGSRGRRHETPAICPQAALLAAGLALTKLPEDDRFGPDRSGFERSGELQRRNDRLAAIRAAKARLEAKQRRG